MALFDTIRAGSSGATTDFEIERSLRFNDGDSPGLVRTPSSASNQRTFTISAWVKRSSFGSGHTIFSAGSNGSNLFAVYFPSEQFSVTELDGGSQHLEKNTTARFRDLHAWYHIVAAIDTTQSTAEDRVIAYINGVRITDYATNNIFSQNTDTIVNTTVGHYVGRMPTGNYFDGYIAEFNFIDGTALTPSSFAETDTVTGEYKPIKYTGSYGSNGFRLEFADNSGTSATTLGKDTSGNSNNLTPSNFSVSAGQGNDSVEDTPTNNFSTFTPLLTDQRTDASYTDGNTKVVTGSGAGIIGNSFPVDSGKWYAEFKCTAKTSVNMGVGIQTVVGYDGERQWNESQNGGFGIAYLGGDNSSSGNKMTDGGGTSSYGASYVVDDIIGVALDVDNKTVNFYKNNSAQGTIDITTTKGDFYVMSVGHGQGGCTNTWEANFGQRAFSYTPPTGFVAMSSQNLADPTIKLSNKYFETLLYTGNGGTQSITGLEFQPDWVWIRERNTANAHKLYDAIRGVHEVLETNGTDAEGTDTNGLTAFNSNGFSVGSSISNNGSGDTYASWNWNAGGSTVTNNNGSISSSVRASTTAGFSIATWTSNGNSSPSSFGHGLGVKPDFLIIKSRGGSGNWQCWSQHFTNATNDFISLNLLDGKQTAGAAMWGTIDSSVVNFRHSANSSNGEAMIGYFFSEVAGYSKFGTYKGNGNSNGTYLALGFRPAWILLKKTSGSGGWKILDSKRDPDNIVRNQVSAEGTGAEEAFDNFDFLSNGIKMKNTFSDTNENGATYIYLAFAESPFKYARAR